MGRDLWRDQEMGKGPAKGRKGLPGAEGNSELRVRAAMGTWREMPTGLGTLPARLGTGRGSAGLDEWTPRSPAWARGAAPRPRAVVA